MARLLSTEAKQADDGRFTILPDLHPYFEAHPGEIEKFCMFFGSKELASEVLPQLAAIPGVEATQGSPDNVEATAAGVNKGTALLALAGQLGIPRPKCWRWATARTTAKCWRPPGWRPSWQTGCPPSNLWRTSFRNRTATTTAWPSCSAGWA